MITTPSPPPTEVCEDTGSLRSLSSTPPASNRASESHPSSSSIRSSSDRGQAPELAAEVLEVLAFLKDEFTWVHTQDPNRARHPNTARLTVEEFEQLESKLRQQLKSKVFQERTAADWYLNKARVNWFPPRDGKLKGELEIKMATPFREKFIALVWSTIMNRITSVAQGGDSIAKIAAMKLSPGGSPTTRLLGGGKMSPDTQFDYDALPTAFVEVGYSQSMYNLKKNAVAWIKEAYHIPTIVISFSLPYQDPGKRRRKALSSEQKIGTYTVYRLCQVVDQDGVETGRINKFTGSFCDDAGNIVENEVGGALELFLNDFLPYKDAVADGSNISMTIKHKDLAEMFVKAREIQEADDRQIASMSAPSKRRTVRGMTPTPSPPPSLSDSDKLSVQDGSDPDYVSRSKRSRDISPSEDAPSKRTLGCRGEGSLQSPQE